MLLDQKLIHKLCAKIISVRGTFLENCALGNILETDYYGGGQGFILLELLN